MEALTPRIPEFAHYYGDFIWDEELTGWIKSLLLFFDGIALALPPEMADRLIEANPVLAQPLAELGLLRNYDPFLRIKNHERSLTKNSTSSWIKYGQYTNVSFGTDPFQRRISVTTQQPSKLVLVMLERPS